MDSIYRIPAAWDQLRIVLVSVCYLFFAMSLGDFEVGVDMLKVISEDSYLPYQISDQVDNYVFDKIGLL